MQKTDSKEKEFFSPLDSTEKKTCTQMQLSDKHFPHENFFNTIKKGTRKITQWGKLSLCMKEAHSSEPSHAHTKTMGLATGAYNAQHKVGGD